MRYWAYFAGKVVVAAGPLYALLNLVAWIFPSSPHKDPLAQLDHGTQYLLCDLTMLVWFLLCAGAMYLIVWDQRRRCRVCLRRLRMPIETGSWGHMLQLGRPRTEFICPYGHGSLVWEEYDLASPEWTPHSEDMWDELCASSKDTRPESAK